MEGTAGPVQTKIADPVASLLAEHDKWLRGLAWGLCKQDPSLRELAYARGAETLWRLTQSYDPSRGAAFKTYAYLHVRRAMLDAIASDTRIWRQSATAAYGSVAALDAEPGEEPAAEPDFDWLADPARHYERSELRQSLAAAIATLDERAQFALSLCYVEGLTQEEAAKVLGLSRHQVARDLRRACAALKTLLNDA